MALTEKDVEAMLRTVIDPELDIDIWTLGFVRKVDIGEGGRSLRLLLTLSSPMCPFAPEMAEEIRGKAVELGAEEFSVDFTFDPPWKPSAEVRTMLGLSS